MTKKIWTYELCQLEALKYKTRIDFYEGSTGAYQRAYRDGWLDKITTHMPKRQPTKWTEEVIREVAKKYSSSREFQKREDVAYRKAKDLGILFEVCDHMDIKPRRKANRKK